MISPVGLSLGTPPRALLLWAALQDKYTVLLTTLSYRRNNDRKSVKLRYSRNRTFYLVSAHTTMCVRYSSRYGVATAGTRYGSSASCSDTIYS